MYWRLLSLSCRTGVVLSLIHILQSPYDKKPREVELVRRQILENQVTYYGVRGDSVGYIYLKGFTDKSAQEMCIRDRPKRLPR